MSFGDFYFISGILYNIYLIFKKIKKKILAWKGSFLQANVHSCDVNMLSLSLGFTA